MVLCIQPSQHFFWESNAQLQSNFFGKDMETPLLLCEEATMLAGYPSKQTRPQGNLIKHIFHGPEYGPAARKDTCFPEFSSSSINFLTVTRSGYRCCQNRDIPRCHYWMLILDKYLLEAVSLLKSRLYVRISHNIIGVSIFSELLNSFFLVVRTQMFIVAFFTIPKKWKQLKRQPIDG